MKQYVEKIILSYITRKREELQPPHDQPALLIFDNIKAQTTSSFLELLDSYNPDNNFTPAKCMDHLRLLGNKSAKDFLCSQLLDWYAKQVFSQLQEGSEVTLIDLNLTIVKPLSAS